MKVKKNSKVKVDYTGKLEDGTVFDTSTHGDHSHPLEFTVGEGKVIKGFEEALIGMDVGEEKVVTLTPEDAYGMPDPKLKSKIPKEQAPPEAKVGMGLIVQAPTGQKIPATVAEVDDSHITIDLNHPLAGKNLIFTLKVVEIS